MILGPAPVLALLVGIFHVSVYVLVRGSAGQRVPVLILAAFLGAWAGDALAGRLGADPLRIGDFHLIGASVLAWVGIVAVAIVAVLAHREPGRRGTDPAAGFTSTVRRGAQPVATPHEDGRSAPSSHDTDAGASTMHETRSNRPEVSS
ncbi:MAG TPA: hypothetical protein VFO50_05910 [Candidatus Limnocylindrales bacterium]|nr:hypothetical protein [Candidatus Limnocylindrales bacterium]